MSRYLIGQRLYLICSKKSRNFIKDLKVGLLFGQIAVDYESHKPPPKFQCLHV